ncbi:hypothetical protein OHA46_33850 (plasmid) [Streptomyces sp. NBC_00708]
MKTTAIARRAELLRLYTGLPWQSALRRVMAAPPGAPLIQQPKTDQLLLEAQVMRALAWRHISTIHPWGIEYVDPRPDQLRIRFGPDPAARRYHEETQVLDLAEVLLPRTDGHGDVMGIPGVRPHVEDGLVVLRMLGTSASVTLLGLDANEWMKAVRYQDLRLAALGMTSCHRALPDQRHPAESRSRTAARRGRGAMTEASAWMASGLLRRVGLIRTLGIPLAVTGWIGDLERAGGEHWIIDPTFAEGQNRTGHRRLMALLSAPGWGMPLTTREEHCNCHLPPGFSDQCTIFATGSAEWPGRLQVRAIHRRGERLSQIQEDSPALYAAQRLLHRAVPPWVDRWVERESSGVSGVAALTGPAPTA